MVTYSTGGSSNYVWQTWQGTTSTSTGTLTATSDNTVWYTWSNLTSTTSTTITTPWTQWVSQPTSSDATYTVTWSTWVETEEQKKERETREAQYRAEAAEREKAKIEADAKAEKLLKENLNDEERARYERAGYFYAKSKSGKLYKVKRGTHGNVIRLNPATKEEEVKYCVQPSGVPVGDANLAQKLWIEHAEEEFLRIANATPLIPGIAVR